MSTWLITGCSTGIGRALAEAVLGTGHNAVITARNPATPAALPSSTPPLPSRCRWTSATTSR